MFTVASFECCGANAACLAQVLPVACRGFDEQAETHTGSELVPVLLYRVQQPAQSLYTAPSMLYYPEFPVSVEKSSKMTRHSFTHNGTDTALRHLAKRPNCQLNTTG